MKKSKAKGGFKAALCLVLALAMCAGLMPSGMTALAADDADADGTYGVTLNQTTGGTLSFGDTDGDYAGFSAGDEVTVEIALDDGYAFLRLTLAYNDGTVVETDDTAELSMYSFTMPDADITVSAEFCDESDFDYGIQTLGGTVNRSSKDGTFLSEGDVAITEDEFYELFNAFMDDSHVKNTDYSQASRWDCSGMVNYFVGAYLLPYSEGTPLKNLPDEDSYETYKYKTTIQQFNDWGTVIYDDGTYGKNISSLSNTNPGDLQPGDLIFYGTSQTYVTHVAMYVGQGSTLKEVRNNSNYNSNGFYQVENESSANQYFYPVEGHTTALGKSGDGVRVNRFHLHTTGNSYGSIYDSLIQTYDSTTAADAIMVVRLYDNEPYSYLTMEKTSENPSITDGNSCYSLEGAEYTVYTDKDHKTVAKDSDGNDAIFTIKADGTTSTIELEPDTYYLYETKVPEGYEPDTQIHVVELTVDYTEDEPYTVSVTECPINDPAGITIYKLDQDTGEYVPEGEASLEGAEFTVDYYDGYYETEANLPSNATRSWVIQTKWDEDSQKYKAFLEDAWKVSGDDFYYQDGDVVLPLGTYAIYETKAPTGYLLEGAFTDENGETVEAGEKFVSVLQNKGDAEWIVGGNYYTQEEPVIRGGLTLTKQDGGTQPKFSATSRHKQSGRAYRMPHRILDLTSSTIRDIISPTEEFEHAKYDLKNTNDSVQNIANAVGYEDPRYFSRVFRHRVGLSPTEYRAKIRIQ